jgi:hypothetical protein
MPRLNRDDDSSSTKLRRVIGVVAQTLPLALPLALLRRRRRYRKLVADAADGR